MKRRLIPFGAFGLAALPAACAVAQSPTVPAAPSKVRAKAPAAKPAMSQRQVIFDKVWTTVRDKHFDPKLGGLDWVAVKRKYLPLALQARDNAAFYAALNQMLGELKQSHLGAIPPQEITPAEAGGADESEGSGGDTGITALLVGGKALITGVAEGSPAEKAGIRPGYELVAVGQTRLAPTLEKLSQRTEREGEKRVLAWSAVRHLLNGPVGKPVAVTVRGEDDAEKVVSVDRAMPAGKIAHFGNLPPIPAAVETRTLAGGIGYVRFNIFLMDVLQPVKDAVARFAAAGAPGIVIDLRGNVGGIGAMAPSIAGMLSSKEALMGTMHLRAATMTFSINPQAPRYAGPVAVLTDEASLSTSEILAGGLQELGRAVVVGRPTGGMVLPSQIEMLPDGGRLQYVTADFRTPKGVLLEGKGVTPDIPVELSRETLLAHPDPTLDAAIEYIQKKAAGTPAAAAVAQEKKP